MSALRNAWNSAYYKTRTESYIATETDAKGNTHIVIKQRTVYYWDEPKELTDKGVNNKSISDTTDFIGSRLNKTEDVAANGPQAFDLSKSGSSLYYPEKAEATGVQNAFAVAAYGLVGTAFVFYEEGFKKIAETQFNTPVIDDTVRMKRRSFLKALVAVPLALKVREFQRKFASENKDLLNVRVSGRDPRL